MKCARGKNWKYLLVAIRHWWWTTDGIGDGMAGCSVLCCCRDDECRPFPVTPFPLHRHLVLLSSVVPIHSSNNSLILSSCRSNFIDFQFMINSFFFFSLHRNKFFFGSNPKIFFSFLLEFLFKNFVIDQQIYFHQ